MVRQSRGSIARIGKYVSGYHGGQSLDGIPAYELMKLFGDFSICKEVFCRRDYQR